MIVASRDKSIKSLKQETTKVDELLFKLREQMAQADSESTTLREQVEATNCTDC